MKYNFDEYIERRNTDSEKWDSPKYKNSDMIPMWVADMDLKSPVEIVEAIRERAGHGVFGYTHHPDELVEVVVERMKKLYGWEICREWIVWLPGLVTGLNVACRSVSANKGFVATACPVYPPFLTAPGNNSMGLQKIPMIEENNRWTMDFKATEAALSDDTRMFILSNPHNPGGTMYTEKELSALYEICARKNVLICSDEIHCDLILDKSRKHVPMASLGEDAARRTITLMAPSKTFNIAGLGCSFAIIPDKSIRDSFIKAADGIVPMINVFGYAAALAAYKFGGEWLEQLLEYLRTNCSLLLDAVNQIPGLRMLANEATYLAWIDTRKTGMDDPARFFEKAGVGISDGRIFGGPGFVRLNFGCPRPMLEEGIRRIRKAFA